MTSEQEVDEVLNEVLIAGGEIVKPAGKTFWGGYSGYFSDLDGYIWEIAHNPFFWIGPNQIKKMKLLKQVYIFSKTLNLTTV